MDEIGEKLAFLKSLNKVQGTLEPVGKDKINPHFKSGYASLAAVNETIMGPLAENGFVLLSGGVEIGGKPWLRTTLLHVGGHSMSFDYPLLVNDDNPQHLASATTYARRYSLCAFFNLSTEDDDGNAASVKTVTREPAQSQPKSDAEIISFVPGEVEVKTGSGPKGPYTKYTVKGDGKFLTTFDETQGQLLISAHQSGQEVRLAFKQSGKYYNIAKVYLNNNSKAEAEIEEVPF